MSDLKTKQRVKKPHCTEPQNMRVDVNKLWSPADYARLMNVSRETIYIWIQKGQIPPNNVYDANGTTLILQS